MEHIKYVGFAIMLIDHISMLYFPDSILGRIIGRLCAPIFFYSLAIGYLRTKDLRKYLERMVMWAIIAQIIIWLLIDFKSMPKLNILFTLAWCLISLHLFNQENNTLKKTLFFISSLFLASLFQFDYGWYAVVSVFLFYFYENTKDWRILWITTNTLTILDNNIGFLQIFAMPSPYLINKLNKIQIELPRLNWYAFYAGHWLFLILPKAFL
jgi:hypothetical protein